MRIALLSALILTLAIPAFAEDLPLEDPSNPVAVIKTSLGDVYVELFVQEAPKTVENFLGLAEGTKEWTDPATGEKVRRPYYDGLIFHRVIKDFMIQGGCPVGEGTGSPGFTFEDEIDAKALGLADIKAFPGGQPHAWLRPSIGSQQAFQQKILLPLLDLMGLAFSEVQSSPEEQKRVQAKLESLSLMETYEIMGYEYKDGLSKHKPVVGVLAMANSGPNTNGSQFFLNLKDTDWLTGKHTVFGKVVKGMDIVEKIGSVKTGQRSKPLEDVKIISIRRMAAD